MTLLLLLAQVAAFTPDDIGGFVRAVVSAASAGQWPMLAALALVAAVWGLRKFVAPKAPFFGTPEGGVVLNVSTSFAGAFLTALVGGTPFTWGLLWASLQVAVIAAGGWSILKSLVLPLLMRIPFLAGLFTAGDAQASITGAQKAGLAAAVAAKTPKSDDLANQ